MRSSQEGSYRMIVAKRTGSPRIHRHPHGQVHFTVLPGYVEKNRHLIGRALA
jgi:quercetin dioxygenase-like cupin family protein